jgi:hypothetical protein
VTHYAITQAELDRATILMRELEAFADAHAGIRTIRVVLEPGDQPTPRPFHRICIEVGP